MKKYEITDIAHPDNPNLHRIRAVTDLTEDVLKGMLGGYVESCDNLDQDGRAWISADAIACENAVVCGDAVLTDRAVAKGCAYVGKNAAVMGDATVQDDAIVCGGVIMGKSCVCGYAVIRQDEQTTLPRQCGLPRQCRCSARYQARQQDAGLLCTRR